MHIHDLSRRAYALVLGQAGFSPAFVDAMLGDAAFENVLFEPFFKQRSAYPWPPCFVPLLKHRSGMEAYGVVLHPFLPQRPPGFCLLYLEEGYLMEVARTPAQFIDLLVLESVISADAEPQLDANTEYLLQRLGQIEHWPALKQAAQATGILEEGLSAYVPGFTPDWPLSLHEYQPLDSYTGHFPVSADTAAASPYEYNFLIAAELVQADTAPRPASSATVARWLALQAPGTDLAQACDEVRRLLVDSTDLLLNAWLTAAEGASGNY